MDEENLDLRRRFNNPQICLGVLLLLLTIVFAGCKKDSRVVFIQGVWYNKNAHLANIPSESAQETNWEFDNHYFEISSCCFIESYFSGNYSITEKKEDELTLELFNMKGQNSSITLNREDTMSLVIKIDESSDTIWINGDGPYSRISP